MGMRRGAGGDTGDTVAVPMSSSLSEQPTLSSASLSSYSPSSLAMGASTSDAAVEGPSTAASNGAASPQAEPLPSLASPARGVVLAQLSSTALPAPAWADCVSGSGFGSGATATRLRSFLTKSSVCAAFTFRASASSIAFWTASTSALRAERTSASPCVWMPSNSKMRRSSCSDTPTAE